MAGCSCRVEVVSTADALISAGFLRFRSHVGMILQSFIGRSAGTYDQGYATMSFLSKFERFLRRPMRGLSNSDALVEGMNNQSQLINTKFEEVIAGVSNQTQLLDAKLSAIIEGMDNQSRLINNKFGEVIKALNSQSRLLDIKLSLMLGRMSDQTGGLNTDFDAGVATFDNQHGKLGTPIPAVDDLIAIRSPLLVAEKTYNTSHPDYDAAIVRNFPGMIFNDTETCPNNIYTELKKLAARGKQEVTDGAWTPVLENALTEAQTDPEAKIVLQRREAMEHYIAELENRFKATYFAGWVNLDDALFLYWLVRKLKPKTIVQCGVCNGLSSAFMTLALAKNGSEGKLHAIDIPPVFNAKDPAWTIGGKTYGVVIPEGKTSGWMVPDAYRTQFEVQSGDAKNLLPSLVDSLPSIDMFYHDSDHTYNHMMFEFREAKRKLVPGGLVVADDISWNSSLWDFADEFRVPAYNFKGAVGVAFF
jgi:predicted O-methyltransferase YrrM